MINWTTLLIVLILCKSYYQFVLPFKKMPFRRAMCTKIKKSKMKRNLTNFDDWQLENKISRPLARTRIQSTLCHEVTVAMVTGRQGSDAQCYLQQHCVLTKRWLHCQLLECDDRSTSLDNPSPGPFRYSQSTDLQLGDLGERLYQL